jgi:hypothetical protein
LPVQDFPCRFACLTAIDEFLLIIEDYLRRRLARLNLRTHFLDLRGLLFHGGRQGRDFIP